MINLTQHAATSEQIAVGVRDLPVVAHKQLSTLLTFDAAPTSTELHDRASQVALLLLLTDQMSDPVVMLGGAPFFMPHLERALQLAGYQCFYAFSTRTVEEVSNDDGSVRKVATFRHSGFVPAFNHFAEASNESHTN